MKTILKAGSLLAMVAVMGASCSVERKTRSGKKNVIDVGMNQKELRNSQAAVSPAQGNVSIAAAR